MYSSSAIAARRMKASHLKISDFFLLHTGFFTFSKKYYSFTDNRPSSWIYSSWEPQSLSSHLSQPEFVESEVSALGLITIANSTHVVFSLSFSTYYSL